MTSDYDTTDPFVNEKLFSISDDVDSINFEVSVHMKCERSLLEIADNETKEIIWDKSWNDSADEELDISLNNLDKEKEYVIRLTCSKVEHAEAVIAFDSSLVEDVVMPRKLT